MAIVEYQVTDTPLWRRWIGKNSSYDSGWRSAESSSGSVDNYTYYWFRMARIVSSSDSIPMAVKSLHWQANCTKNEYREVTFTFYDGDPFNGGLPYKTVTQGLDGTGTLIVDADIEREFPTGEFYCRLSWEYGFESTPIPQVTAELHLQTPDVTLVSPLDTSVDGADYVYFRYQTDYHGLSPASGLRAGIQWRTEDGEWNSIMSNYNPSSENTVTASIGIFPEGKIIWRTRGQAQYAGAGEFAEGEFTVAYERPQISIIKPVGEVDGSTKIQFEWASQTPSGKAGNYVEIDYSYDQESWENLTSGGRAASEHNHTYESNWRIFNPGVVYYRIREKVYKGNYGEYAYGSFTALESVPYVSELKPNGKYQDKSAPINLTWYASISYGAIAGSELEYDLSDGQGWRSLGTVTGSDKSYTVPANTFPAVAYTDNAQRTGGIRIRVRSKNAYSSWAEASFTTVDAPTTARPASPANGASKSERQSITFQWYTSNITGSNPSGADLQYRYADDTWQTLGHVDGNEKTFTAEPDTFIGAVVYWRVRAYNQDGIAGDWSSEAYFSTIDAPSVSTPISPSGTIEDTDSDLVFRWSTSSTSGSTPTGADLQYSYDGITWLVLGHTDGTTQLTVSGGRIHAGTVQWQVRSYNRNGTPGAWSASATFVAHAAPRILDLITDDKPFTTFTWQATDQRDYHIVIDDDLVIGPVFDEVKTYQLTDYLEDGLHTVKIRVQNEMSVWSEWAETQFQVLNIPDGEIELQGSWDIDADLFWEDQAADAEYMVYRDGGLIGKTHSKAFADRVVLGEHRYHVIRRLSDGCYSISNTVSGSMSTRLTRVAPLVGGEWLALVKSENAKRSERFTRRRKVAYHHFSGNKFPTPEIGDQEELIGEYDAAWMHTEEGAKILDSLVGQAIIVKSRSGKVIIGVLEGYTSGDKKHFSGFTFDLKQMDWEDYVCDI